MLYSHKKPKRKSNQTSTCKFCGERGHTKFDCFNRPKTVLKNTKKLRQESLSTRQKRQEFASEWFQHNWPKDGQWICWLQISKKCPIKLTRDMVQLEHVYPKRKFPELKYIQENVKPSCEFCNELKRGNTPEQLALLFPSVSRQVLTEAWKEYVIRLSQHSEQLVLQLE
jgi:hypothetical protein